MLCCPPRRCFLSCDHQKTLPHFFTLQPQLTQSIPFVQENNDDTERATDSGRGSPMLTLKDWYWRLGLRNKAVGISEDSHLFQKADSHSSRWQFWSCFHHSINHATYTIPVHLSCVCFSPWTHPIFPTEKMLWYANNPWCFTKVTANS